MKVDAFHSLTVDADGLVDPRPPAPVPLHSDPDDFDWITPISPHGPLHCGPEQPKIQTALITKTTTTTTLPPPSDSPPPIILHHWRHVRILVNVFW